MIVTTHALLAANLLWQNFRCPEHDIASGNCSDTLSDTDDVPAESSLQHMAPRRKKDKQHPPTARERSAKGKPKVGYDAARLFCCHHACSFLCWRNVSELVNEGSRFVQHRYLKHSIKICSRNAAVAGLKGCRSLGSARRCCTTAAAYRLADSRGGTRRCVFCVA